MRTVVVLGTILVAGCGGNYTYGPALAAPGGVAVSLLPLDPTVAPGGQIQFAATVTGNANVAVTWSVKQTAGTPTSTGTKPTITANGLFTAGSSTETVTVTAVSVANDSIFALTTVTVANVSGS